MREDAAVVIQQQLKEIGIEAKPQIVEFSALIEQTSAPNWDYDALLLGWSLATFLINMTSSIPANRRWA